MDLSVIIVNYNTKDLLRNCLKSILEFTEGIEYDVWVVDNESSDSSPDMVEKEFPNVNLIRNYNGGFSQANNLAIRKCTDSKYILLLNPDTIIIENTLKYSVDIMDNKKNIGCLGCKVVRPDGSLDRACKRGFPSPWNSLCYFLKLDKIFPKSKKIGGYNATYIGEDEESEMDCLVGAYMMIRKEVLDKIGLLDESFFMYGEDIDLCYRIKEAGWINYYYPSIKIIHYKGESSRKQSTKMIGIFHKSMFIFYNKHYKNKNLFIVNWLIYLGIYAKWGLSLVKNLFRKKKKVS